MKGYFYLLLITSVCGSICTILSLNGFEKYIKYVVSLICVLVVVSPIRQIDFNQISQSVEEMQPSVENIDTQLNINSQTLTEKMAVEYISQTVFSKFGIKPISVNIKINWTEKEGVIENIIIEIPKENGDMVSEIEEYLFTLFLGEVKVNAV